MSNIIEVKNLVKKYSNKMVAVNEISLTVHEGEIFGFLGPNGAGKSTTIKMLTTLCRPTSGSAIISNIDVVENAIGARMQFGYVSQDLAVDEKLTGRENLYLQSQYYHMQKKEAAERIGKVLELVNLKERADELVDTYSGGMRKRIDIACALMHKPKILFLDEPTLGLDIQTRREIWEYINYLRTELKTTIFLTTHYMEEADAICDRIAIIDKGVIKTIDTPKKLKENLGGDIIEIKIDKQTEEESKNVITKLNQLSFTQNVEQDKNKFTIIVNDGEATIPVIFKALENINVKITNVLLKKPTLDDVFLKFTGKSLRDGQQKQEEANRIVLRRAR